MENKKLNIFLILNVAGLSILSLFLSNAFNVTLSEQRSMGVILHHGIGIIISLAFGVGIIKWKGFSALLIKFWYIPILMAGTWLVIIYYGGNPLTYKEHYYISLMVYPLIVCMAIGIRNLEFPIKERAHWFSLTAGLCMFVVILLFLYKINLKNFIILFSGVILSVLIYECSRKKFLLWSMGTIIGITLFFTSVFMNSYRYKSVMSFNSDGIEYLKLQSYRVLGDCDWGGHGFTSHFKHHLPEAYSDFVFTTLCWHGGFILGIIVLLAEFFILYCGYKITFLQPTKERRILASACTVLLSIQVILHLLVVMGLMPIIGMNLPFISLGIIPFIINIIAVAILIHLNGDVSNQKVDKGFSYWKQNAIYITLAFFFIGISIRGISISKRFSENKTAEKSAGQIPARGKIIDSNGKLLVSNSVAYDIRAEVHQIKAIPSDLFEKIRKTCTIDLKDAEQRIERAQKDDHPYRTITIEKKLSDIQVQEIKKEFPQIEQPGIYFHEVPSRYVHYPQLAPEVLGLAGDEQQGLSGIEYSRNRHLSSGNDIQLTLNSSMQRSLKNALHNIVVTSSPVAARALVIKKDGSVIAMAQFPTFNPENPETINSHSINSAVVGDLYEPGGVLMPLVLAAALDKKLISKEDTFDTKNGRWKYKGVTLYDAFSFRKPLHLEEVIVNRSQIAAAQAALRVGPEKMYEIMRMWGVGSKSGIELEGESIGLLERTERWSGITLTRLPLGQESAWNIAQIARAYTGVVNNGLMPNLTLLKQDKVPDKEPVRVLAPECAEWLLGLFKTAQCGEQKIRFLNSTSMIAEHGKYSKDKVTQTHIGFYPLDNPEYTIVLQSEKPQIKAPHFGSDTEMLLPVYDTLKSVMGVN